MAYVPCFDIQLFMYEILNLDEKCYRNNDANYYIAIVDSYLHG